MEQYINNKKYPKSSSGKQCVGPCYKKNTKIIHPIYLDIITDNYNDAFCPVAEWTRTNNNKVEKYQIDKCDEETYKKNKNDFTTTYDLLYPYVDFNEEIFLELFYNINKFSDAIQWIEDNKNLPIDSKQRIFDLALDAFGSNLDIIETSDTRIVDFIFNLFKIKFFNNVVTALLKYININNKIVELKYNDKKETDETIVIKTNYINKNILTIENVTNFISNYFRSSNKEIRMQSPSEIMVNKFINFIIGNIKKTFIK